jgi:hypothetical protein
MKECAEPAAIADYIREIEKNLETRVDTPKVGKLSIRKCGEADIPGVIAMMAELGIPITAGDVIPLLKFGELWCLDNSGVIVATGGWLTHGEDSAWIGMIMTVPAWRKLSIATCFMKLVLERTADCPVRMLDASDMGEPIYRRLGFEECAKVHLLEVPVGTSPAPRFAWRPMREADFPLPGTCDKDPAHRYIFGNNRELCRALEKDGRIVAWFLGCEKGSHVHIGQIYAEDEDMAVDAFHAAREMLPGRKLTLSVPPMQKKLFAAVTAAGATLIRIHTRMYLAKHPVPPVPSGIRSSAGPDFG